MANNKKMVEDITSMEVDFAKWYTDIVKKAELCDYSSVKGCMIVRPYGYAIWENIQHILDAEFKKTGHQNVAMPLFIPESLLQKLHGLPTAVLKSWKNVCAFVQPPRLCSVTTTRTSSNPTVTCQNCTTSGAALFVGKKPPVHSCAPVSSSGRKATPCTKLLRRLSTRPR